MRNLILSIYSTLNCAAREYHNCNHRPETKQKKRAERKQKKTLVRIGVKMILAQPMKLPNISILQKRDQIAQFRRPSLCTNRLIWIEKIKWNKMLGSNTTSANPLYCSHFLHVHLFKSSYGILEFSLQNQQLTVAGKRRLWNFITIVKCLLWINDVKSDSFTQWLIT